MRNSTESDHQVHDFDTERNGYNLAFSELGLEWYWDTQTYAALGAIGAETSPVQAYLERHQPHLLKAYDAGFLTNAVETVRSRYIEALSY